MWTCSDRIARRASLRERRSLCRAGLRHGRQPAVLRTLLNIDKLNKISQPVQENDRSYRGFNFFDPEDEDLFEALGSGEFNISGFQNKDLRRRVGDKNTGQVSRLMERVRTHGLIKKIGL
jgi:hypothetical protein